MMMFYLQIKSLVIALEKVSSLILTQCRLSHIEKQYTVVINWSCLKCSSFSECFTGFDR